MSKLLELAERCEEAVEADRLLDAEIHEAITTFPARIAGPGWPKETEFVVPVFPGWAILPPYTASIDAALKLIPEQMRDEIDITTLYCVARVGINLNHGPSEGPFYGSNKANSIPLALCAAALKAQDATNA